MSKVKKNPEKIIYDLIIRKIANKELFPNNQIRETQLAKETGISRTPIREALKKLSFEGIITIIPNRGAFVSDPTLDEIKSVYECKAVLESAAIRLACINIKENELNALYELLDCNIKAHERKDLNSFIKLNEEFHMTIAKISKNKYYEKFIKELINKSNAYLIFYDKFMITSMDDSDAIKEHYKILNALKSRNQDECAEVIQRHNEKTFAQLSLNGIIS